jgi:hypothetical protein
MGLYDLIILAQDRDQWKDLSSAIVKHRVP